MVVNGGTVSEKLTKSFVVVLFVLLQVSTKTLPEMKTSIIVFCCLFQFRMSYNNSTNVTCSERASNDESMVEIYLAISWWFEYFLQTGIGIAGLIANTLAIPILLSVKTFLMFVVTAAYFKQIRKD